MPCYSRVQGTKLTDAERLIQAMTALGYKVDAAGSVISASGFRFARSRAGAAFNVETDDAQGLIAISRKYAELSVRAFAQKRGFSVTANDGKSMTLINRRVT